MPKKSKPADQSKSCLPLQVFEIPPGASRLAIDVSTGEFSHVRFGASSLLVIHAGTDDVLLLTNTTVDLPAAGLAGVSVTNEGGPAVLESRPFNPPPPETKDHEVMP